MNDTPNHTHINPIDTPNITAYCDDTLIDFIKTLDQPIIDDLESTLNHLESFFMTLHQHSYQTAKLLHEAIGGIFDNSRDLLDD